MPRFDCATWRPIGANTGGRMARNIGLALHHAVASGSLFAVFNRPGYGASTHFWVSQSGVIEQYVDTDVVAWANGNGDANASYCSVETEGCTSPANGYADPMSDAMVDALARLYAEGMRRHGWPAALANAAGAPGFAYHRLFYATACPCDVRVNRRQDILNKATGATAPTPPARKGTRMWTMKDKTSGGTWVADESGAVFAYDGAPYLGGANVHTPDPSWPCSGLAEYSDDKGEGYLVTLDAGAGARGDRFLRYRFPRDGSAASRA